MLKFIMAIAFKSDHYPTILQLFPLGNRAEAHEDINLITLLVGASAEWIASTGCS
ncbi:MAG: hypothetical protein IPH74_15820 [Bacteroidetes bacterium]|nr:hypothetical protein [Bacteroidota bacterium]